MDRARDPVRRTTLMTPAIRRAVLMSFIAVVLIGIAMWGSAIGAVPAPTDGSATSANRAEKTIKVGYVTSPTHPYGKALQMFADRVGKVSSGRLGIELVPTYAGGDDIQLLNDMRDGTITAGSVSAAVWELEGVDSFEALQMPFLVNSYALESAVLASPIAAQMLKGTKAIELTGIAIHEGGIRKPASASSCLLSPSDFAGVKVRSVESPLLTTSLFALGAKPVLLPLSDVYLGLQQKVAHAIEANLGLVYTQKLYEVLTCMSGNVNLWPFPTVLAMNTRAWNRLTDDQEKWIRAAAKDLASDSLAILTDPASTLVGDLCTAGLKFGNASPAQIAALRAAVQPVYDKYSRKQPTGSIIKQIEALKASISPPAPKPFPAGCTAP